MIEHPAPQSSSLDRIWNHCLTLNCNVTLCKNFDNQYIVADESSAQYFVCNSRCYAFLQHLDGQKTVRDVVLALAIDHKALPELELLLTKLTELGLINKQQPAKKNIPWWHKLRYPVAMKFKLFNPNQILRSLHVVGDLLFSRFFVFIFCLLLATSLILLPQQWSSLEEHWNSRFFETQNWLMFFLAYILLKAMHELGHGLAVTKQGGRVTECGILWLVFMPLPYINTSSSYLFAKRSQRVLVGFAGIWFELTLAMLAFVYWGTLAPGYFKDFIFNISFIGSFSTLIFNLNPLMKFDGYYILSDVMGVLNLNERAVRAFKNLLKTKLFKLSGHTQLLSQDAHKHTYLFYLYAILAIPYRVVIGLTIALYLSNNFFIFGLILACWVILFTICIPAFKNISRLYRQAIKEDQRYRFLAIISGTCCLIFFLLSAEIFNFSSNYPTLTIMPSIQTLKAKTQGTVKQLHVSNHQYVVNNTLILTLDNPLLIKALAISKEKLREYKAQYRNLQLRDKTMAQSWQEKTQIQDKKVAELHNKVSALAVRSTNNGEVVINNFNDLSATYLQRGDTIGHIVDHSTLTVSAIIEQAKIDTIRNNINKINIMFYTNPGEIYTASVSAIKPAVYSQLPSRFLGSSTGGKIVVDARDTTGKKTLVPFFVIELTVHNHHLPYLPARGIVKFNSAKTSVLSYFWQRLKFIFSSKINW